MEQGLHTLCKQCKYDCKMFSHVDILTCKFIQQSKEAKKIAQQCTKEWEEKKSNGR